MAVGGLVCMYPGPSLTVVPISVCQEQEKEQARNTSNEAKKARAQSKGNADQGQDDPGDPKRPNKDPCSLASKTPATTQKQRVFGKGELGRSYLARVRALLCSHTVLVPSMSRHLLRTLAQHLSARLPPRQRLQGHQSPLATSTPQLICHQPQSPKGEELNLPRMLKGEGRERRSPAVRPGMEAVGMEAEVQKAQTRRRLNGAPLNLASPRRWRQRQTVAPVMRRLPARPSVRACLRARVSCSWDSIAPRCP